jgi:peptidoglycan/xylan/chitin deacetylase (PgdA/CDA1 family)
MKKFNSSFLCNMAIICGCILSVNSFAATPVTTVAWNGYSGAVSFTFDDGLGSQITNLKPMLDQMPDVHVTLFVTGAYAFNQNKTGFAALAKAGHELGNHTSTHARLTETGNLSSEVTGFIQTIKNVDPVVEVTTFATPYCASNNNVKSEVNKNHFMLRNCGGQGLFSWGQEPDWMNMDSHYWQGNLATSTGHLNSAASGKWHVHLSHGVGGDWDIISTNDLTSLIQTARDKKLWMGSYSEVGAYYRAHFTMDKAQSTTTSDGFKVTWTSPHSAMPKSVPLRVKIDVSSVGSGAVVEQKGKVISPESDGSYIIEFMALELDVKKSGSQPSSSTSVPESSSSTGITSSASAQSPFSGSPIAIPGTLEMENYDLGGANEAYFDSDDVNEGAASATTPYRNDGVDVGGNAGENAVVGWTATGEWLEYTVQVAASGTYKFVAHVATEQDGGTFHIEIDGTDVTGPVTATNSGGWDTYATVEGTTQNLAMGTHILRFVVDQASFNIDKIIFSTSSTKITQDLKYASTNVYMYEIFDLQGKLLMQQRSMNQNVTEVWKGLNKNLSNGAYFIRYGEKGKNLKTQKVYKTSLR